MKLNDAPIREVGIDVPPSFNETKLTQSKNPKSSKKGNKKSKNSGESKFIKHNAALNSHHMKSASASKITIITINNNSKNEDKNKHQLQSPFKKSLTLQPSYKLRTKSEGAEAEKLDKEESN